MTVTPTASAQDLPPTDFDAIVVGSGITGGIAAKELTERGLRTLVLERGAPIEHRTDYAGEHKAPWDIPYGGLPLRELYDRDYSIQQRCYAFDETTRPFWNNDRENPYVFNPDKPFTWIRANVVGGRSLMWARQSYRWSDLDFAANKTDGHGVDWPIRYADLAPWYSRVEEFIGVSGENRNLSVLPDGNFQPPMQLNVVEQHVAKALASKLGRTMMIGRTAVLTEPKPEEGRAACHYCGPCHRGCSVGAYFSSQASSLPAAERTGNLTLRPHSVVESLEQDADTGRVSAVRVIDAQTRERLRFTGKLIFLNASAIASAQILLNSRSADRPEGLANRSGAVGRYLMDHTFAQGAYGVIPGFENYTTHGLRPNGVYIPRFQNLPGDKARNFVRGFGYQGGAARMSWRQLSSRLPGYGARFKNQLEAPGPWVMSLGGFGECLPRASNRMLLHPREVDSFGIPQVAIDFEFSVNEKAMQEEMVVEAVAMLKAAGATNIVERRVDAPGGLAIHEMGTARMGRDPATSVLNGYCQAHDVSNLFVTDGAAMTSSSCVNPSLTYMALTARAADYAAERLRAGQV